MTLTSTPNGFVPNGPGSVFDGALAAGAAPAAPLLLTATLTAKAIATPSPASWVAIDPERSHEMPPNYGT